MRSSSLASPFEDWLSHDKASMFRRLEFPIHLITPCILPVITLTPSTNCALNWACFEKTCSKTGAFS